MATFLNQNQRRTLAAICDTFIAALTDDEIQQIIDSSASALIGNDYTSAEEHARCMETYGRINSSTLGVAESVEDSLARHLPSDTLREVGILLTTMGTRIGMFVLTGYFKAVADLTRPEREAALLAMNNSRFEAKRKAFKNLQALAGMHTLGFTRGKQLWQVMGYPGPESAEQVAAVAAATGRDEHIFTMINSTIQGNAEMKFDVVIVGSGCGGSVVASELAMVGHRVLVVEKGTYYRRDEVSGVEGDALDRLYERGGLLCTEDTSIAVLAGSAFGGGSAVNWACSLRTPDQVRQEWAVDYGLKSVAPGSASFDASLEAVCTRLGVTTEGIAHSRNNQLFFDSCKSLGYDVAITGQNMNDVSAGAPGAHFISNGDRYGIKRSTVETYLRDAATATNPAVFADRCSVERVLHEKGKVVGVVAHIVGADGLTLHQLIVKAPVVVVACGSINSPALLLRSKLPNRYGQIGKNLRLHPVCGITGIMPDDAEDVSIWNGAPMTTVSNEIAAGRDRDGYGAKLECPVLHVGIASSINPFFGSRSYKQSLLQLRKAFVQIVLTRDRDSGEVRLDGQGKPRLYYPFSEHDRQSLLDGMERCMRIAAEAGAQQLTTGQLGFAPETEGRWWLPAPGKPERERALESAIQRMREIGLPNLKAGIFSAHQMGTCRMGSDIRSSVVKETGESWEIQGLYVADASTFPTASGVNPMITTMTLAHLIAQGLKKHLAKNLDDNGVLLDSHLRSRL